MIAGTGRAALTAVKVGSQGLRSRPMRTFLAAISLFLGVLSVVMVHAAADIAERAVTERAELSSGRSPTYTSELAAGGARGLDHLASVTTGTGASATVTVPGLLGDPSETAGGSGRVSLELVGLHGDLRRARPFRLAAGAWLPTGGPSSLAPRLVLNTAAAEAIPAGGGRVPAALTIAGGQVRPTPRLIGVVDDGTDQPAAYARLDELLRWEPTLLERFGPKLVVHEPGGAERAVLNTRLGALGVEVSSPFARTDSASALAGSVALVRQVFVVIAAVALLVGMIGILNIGLATVGERVDELALRRAVGTRRSVLGGIVLAEAALIGLGAAGAAIGVAVAGVDLVTEWLFSGLPPGSDLAFPVRAAMLGTGFGMLAAVLGGAVPAWRAARIPIAAVMRA